MLSRKEFFKDLLARGIRAANELTGDEGRSAPSPGAPAGGFDLPATELSPALLAIEAECRGIDIEQVDADDVRRVIYEELVQKSPEFTRNWCKRARNRASSNPNLIHSRKEA